MNTKKYIAIVVAVFQLSAVIAANAQITLPYISSTSKPTGAFLPVGNDMWRAQGFGTGTNPLGYRLDSISLLMGDTSGVPDGFNVSLYSYSGVFPGEHLWTLAGSSDPSTAGLYSYVGADDITLLPSTGYFLVATGAQPLAEGSYALANLAVGSVHEKIDGWVLGHWAVSPDGLAWERVGGSQPIQFDVSATAIIPEPSHMAWLFGAGVLLIAIRFRR